MIRVYEQLKNKLALKWLTNISVTQCELKHHKKVIQTEKHCDNSKRHTGQTSELQ